MSVSFSEDFDVVIVGSGPTGATYARIITDEAPGARVLLVEAGPATTNPPGHHLANIADNDVRLAAQLRSQGPVKTAYAPMTEEERVIRLNGGPDHAMLRRPGLFVVGGGPIDGDEFPAGHAASAVGGMAAHWFGACPRPSKEERTPYVDGKVLDGVLTEAEGLLRVSNTQFPDSPVSAPLRKALAEIFNEGRSPERPIQPMPMALVRTETRLMRSGPDVIFDKLLSNPPKTFELRPDTVCMRILMDGGKATGVELKDTTTGKLYNVKAANVVAAADSLHTPQLLFASGIRPDALGRYLNEHPQVSIYCEFDAGEQAVGSPLDFSGGVLSDRTAISRMESGVVWIPYDGPKFPYHVQISEVLPSSIRDERDDNENDKPVLSVSFFLTSELQRDNRVTFSETEKDWHGRPKMKIRFKLSERDLQHMDQARRDLAKICDKLGRALPGHKPRTPPNGSSLHYQGTVRMGATAEDSVCDRNSRVWGTDNVYVAGNGVIPTETAGNPTLTAVALAILGARDIVAHLGAKAKAPALQSA